MQASTTHTPKFRTNGFTILELIITLAVIAILVNIAIPSFWTTQQSMRVGSAANNLHGIIHHARSAASKTQQNLQLCPMDGDWTKGVYTTFAACDGTVPSDPERRSYEFDSQVTVKTEWSTNGLTFTADGAVTSDKAITPFDLGGTSSRVTVRRVRLTTTGTSKIEHVGTGT
ncbi:GspH/FimT family pseudopilin [Marinobacter sp.]|uniref:GspH/FimT family pseudopilin n=1 Tax=Marinobacter sp. TaxID=50741 RepID=UPI002B26B1BC|nr:GspH/FimT family pseudopilin [Marinobacter sp.]